MRSGLINPSEPASIQKYCNEIPEPWPGMALIARCSSALGNVSPTS